MRDVDAVGLLLSRCEVARKEAGRTSSWTRAASLFRQGDYCCQVITIDQQDCSLVASSAQRFRLTSEMFHQYVRAMVVGLSDYILTLGINPDLLRGSRGRRWRSGQSITSGRLL